jgi:nitronate monooxygenase
MIQKNCREMTGKPFGVNLTFLPVIAAPDYRIVMRPLRNTERVLRNGAVDRLLEKERRLGANITFEDIREEVAGVYPRIMQQGEINVGAWSCGMVAGLIHDVPTVKDLIDRIMSEARDIIRGRLMGSLAT